MATFLAVFAALALASCGGGVTLPDLFVVQRAGSVPSAALTVLVNEGGAIHCYRNPAHRGPARQLSDAQLVHARGIAEDLQAPSAKHLSLLARPGSVFNYYVRDAEGTVRFADNSERQPAVLRQLAYFVLEVAQKVCDLPE